MTSKMKAWLALLAFLSGYSGATAGCDRAGAVRQICGLQSPEDMELLPDGNHMLISETAGPKGEPGSFATLEIASGTVTQIEPESAAIIDWGDHTCRQRTPVQLSPHGIHLSRQPDGRLLLLAINHGDQESVHAYDVRVDRGHVRMIWRGCVNTSFNFNDLAATPDGFIATHQYDKNKNVGPDAERFLFGGGITGFAVRWSSSTGFRKISGTEAAFPNGITVSADGKTAWMVATTGREVRKIDLTRNIRLASAPLPVAPDNLSWTAQGQLLVTGALDVHRLVRCADHGLSCPVPFGVVRIDPQTLENRLIFRNDGRLLLGASVAVITGDRIYVGSFAGDHILEAPAPDAKR
jgi:sugar lactone lactonase YvrE